MQSKIHAETIARFWSKTSQSGDCLEWTASINRGGYGQFNAGNKRIVLAHRFSWEIANGPIPDGLLVCHDCDNRKCVELAHLFLGTHKDNNNDMFSKGRGHVFDGSQAIGENNVNAKLTKEMVSKVKGLLSAGASLGIISKEFGITKQAVMAIRDEETWKGVKPSKPTARQRLSLPRPSGENNNRAVMTWKRVMELRKARQSGEKLDSLATRFGISRSTVKQIVRGDTWKEASSQNTAHPRRSSEAN